MTDDQIAAIAERAQKATPGPWSHERCEDERGGIDYDIESWSKPARRLHTKIACSAESRFDAEFIAHARQDIPDLLAALAAATQENERLKAESVQAMARHYGCGEHVSFSDAWRWLAERVEVVRELQRLLRTHESAALTASGAIFDRIAATNREAAQTAERQRDALREAVAAFLTQWAVVEPRIGGVFALQQVRTGVRYDGPTLVKELEGLRAALAATEGQ